MYFLKNYEVNLYLITDIQLYDINSHRTRARVHSTINLFNLILPNLHLKFLLIILEPHFVIHPFYLPRAYRWKG